MVVDVNAVISKILNSEELSVEERWACAWGKVGKFITTLDGTMHRWTLDKQTIFDVDGQLYCIDWDEGLTEYHIDWDEGLTEYQEHEYWNDPYKVVRKTEMIEVEYYEKVED